MSEFYLRDSRSNTGANVMFWREKGGYTTNVAEAEVFTLERAQSQYNCRDGDDQPLLKSEVDALTHTRVDMQLLRKVDESIDCDEYVFQKVKQYSGNDIYFVATDGSLTLDPNKAAITQEASRMHLPFDAITYELKVWPKSEIMKIARTTFEYQYIDTKTMMRKAGIKMIPRKRHRPTSGKTKGNCPVCGRIAWDYDPHVAPFCNRHDEDDLN